jgi:hypothetical protein
MGVEKFIIRYFFGNSGKLTKVPEDCIYILNIIYDIYAIIKRNFDDFTLLLRNFKASEIICKRREKPMLNIIKNETSISFLTF